MDEIEYREAVDSDIEKILDLQWSMEEEHEACDPRYYRNVGAEVSKDPGRRCFRDLLGEGDCISMWRFRPAYLSGCWRPGLKPGKTLGKSLEPAEACGGIIRLG